MYSDAIKTVSVFKQGGEMCHFPFKYKNVTYTSCAHVKIPGFNLQGEPWCATQVKADDGLTVVDYKWSLCQDERGLILDDEGKNYTMNVIERGL